MVTALEGAAEDPVRQAGEVTPAGAVGHVAKPLLRGWLHLISFEASLVLGTLARTRTHGAVRVTALAVFALSVSGMFGPSALYHRGNWGAAWHRRLQRLDHAMIFLLIAGTATPAFLLAAHGIDRIAGLITIWALALHPRRL